MPVEVQELPCREGHIGLLTLNEPGTLNALTEEMVNQAQQALAQWAEEFSLPDSPQLQSLARDVELRVKVELARHERFV